MSCCRVLAWVIQVERSVLLLGVDDEEERVRMLARVVSCSLCRDARREERSAGVRVLEERESASG